MEIAKNTNTTTERSYDWLIIFCIYLVLLAVHGYRFGDEDMSETLSYALFIQDNSLYIKDLYIQAVGQNHLNERFPFTLLLSIFSSQLEWGSFFLHISSSLLLIWGLLSLASIYLRQKAWQIGFLVSTLILIYNTTLGGNEIWYNYFVPSHLAKAIAIWGFVFWLRDKPMAAYITAAIATFAQPVVGAQIALLFFLVDFTKADFKSSRLMSFIKGPLIYGMTAGVWIATIFIGHIITDHTISNADFYEIMEVRLGHHFFPSYYPLKSWVLLLPLFIIGAFLWKKIEQKILHLFYFAFIGMLFYFTAIEIFEFPSVLSIQWFKTTVWLKPLSLLAIFILVEKYSPVLKFWINGVMLASLVLFSGLQLSGTVRLIHGRPYHFPFLDYQTKEMQIAFSLKNLLPKNACIIIPPNVTGIRFFSQRSIFVDYKSNIHSKKYLSEAHRRRKQLYNIDLDLRQSGKDIVVEGAAFYAKLREHDFQKLKEEGATHVLTLSRQRLNLPVIATNDAFMVYEL